MTVELYSQDWFWWAMFLGFFVQFAAPMKEPPKAKPAPKRKTTKRNEAPKIPKPEKTKTKKQKARKPEPWTPEQYIRHAKYIADRDGWVFANNIPA
jgi:hypothetical protein